MKARWFSKKWRLRLLLLFFGCVGGVVLCEVALRICGISYPVFETYDHHRAVALKPGKEGWYEMEGRGYVKVNSFGYRDIEHSIEKPPGVFRIAVLGDSFAQAREVDISETFWKLLETNLQSRPEFAGRKVEVMNFGVGGYGTTQELFTLRLHVLDFSPDVVLLAFYGSNDIANNSKRIASTDFRPYYFLKDGELVLDNSFRDFSLTYLRRRFLLYAIHYSRTLEVINNARRILAARRLRQKAQQLGEAGLWDVVYAEPKDEIWKEAWQVTEMVLERMNQETMEGGARFVLVTLSAAKQVDPDPVRREQLQHSLGVNDLFYPERRLSKLGERLGFTVITLAQRLQTLATEQQVHFHGFENTAFGVGHWNKRAHRVVADMLTQDLSGILSDILR